MRPRTVLICHADSRLNRDGIARWLSSFSQLAGVIAIEETRSQKLARVRRELKRVGPLRFLDVLAFRPYYALLHAGADAAWLRQRMAALALHFPEPPAATEVLRTADPNGPEAEAFLRRLAPDLALVRCKVLLKERIFSIPRLGMYVLHPGICPEYRNAHGCFWALARRDHANVGMTLLKIDRGIDTGPVYGYYRCDIDEARESHLVIMARVVLDNLHRISDRLLEICAGTAEPLDTRGRVSGTWGQPWLTSYLRWKWDARRRRHAGAIARIS